ncbi:MAG: AAA family ATPase [Chloroflexi bacterium]|nr:AAA family ATPase [Chloroflexota bacterium]
MNWTEDEWGMEAAGPFEVAAAHRLLTGVSGLDTVLRGGIPRYAVVLIAGQPGTGKTILCQQILFNNIDNGKRCVYLTTVSESPMKVARYQAQFSFFDPDRFGKSMIFMDAGQIIRSQGIKKALRAIVDSLRDIQPAMVAIDSFKAIHDLAASPEEMRTFVFDVSVELAALQSTSLLVGEYETADLARYPEFAIADGIIWLHAETRETDLMRNIRVLKMRGIDHSTMAYDFGITHNGIEVFTTEGLIPTEIAPYGKEITKTGLAELDEILRGGIPKGAPLLLTGGAGTGKTTLGLQFLYEGATRYGDKCIYFSYEEPTEQLIANARRFGWDLRKLIDDGRLRIIHVPLPQIHPSEQLLAIRGAVRGFGAQRAVLDSLTMMMARVSEPSLIRSHVYSLAAIFKDAGCTALITSDPPVGAPAISRFGVEESIIDGVVLLKLAREARARVRYLEVYKMRGVFHATGDNLMKITPRGIQVYPRLEEALE